MKSKKPILTIFVILLVAFCVVPFLYILIRSVISPYGGFTLDYFYKVFLAQSQYLIRFWKSLGLSVCIAIGQVLVSILAGYGFAKSKFPGHNIVFFLLIIGMIMPLQVTLVPNYLVLDAMELLETYYALALPMIFVPLGTFIMTQSFRAVPTEVIEAAQLDGTNTLGVIFKIMVPMSKSGLVCTLLLSFLDGWNMVEQPIVFLKDLMQYPLAVALAYVPPGDPNIRLVCSILVAIPPLLLFAFFNRELAEGIELGGGKAG